jgi:hypothetical protein
MSDAEPEVVSDELELVVPDVEADEFLERFVSANWLDRRGNLKWQALQIHPKDEGALSVARLHGDADQCRTMALSKMNSFVGFAETVAGQMTGLGHSVKAEPEAGFPNHAVVNFQGLDPDWPVPHEVGEPGPAKIAERNYYLAMLPSFTFFAVPDPDAAEWGAERLGQVA